MYSSVSSSKGGKKTPLSVKMRGPSPNRLAKSLRKTGASGMGLNSPSSGRYLRARDGVCRSLRLILPILALYTLFSFGWTRPVSVVTQAVSDLNVQPELPQPNIAAKSNVRLSDERVKVSELDSPKDETPNISSTSGKSDTTASAITAESPTKTVESQHRKETDSGRQVKELPKLEASDLSVKPPSTDTGPTDLLRPTSNRLETYKRERPQCSFRKGRAQSFLMVFMGHSGSSAIMTELKDHPEVLVHRLEPVDHRDFEGNTTKALEFTRQFFDLGMQQGKVPGFKIRPNHIRRNPKAWAALAREYNTRIIWQYRRNTVKQAVGEYSYRFYKDTSILEGLKTEEEVSNRCDIGAGCSFMISDYFFFHQLLTHIVRSDHLIGQSVQYIDDGRDCVHELRYEDYLYHRAGAIQDLYEFLGIEQVKTQPARFKATNDNLCEVVENWTDLCRNFYGCTLWRPHFEDERNGCGCRFSTSPWKYCNTTIVDHVTDVVLP